VRCYQDPYSRRATWEMLQQRREGRVLVLTTHFMVSLV
jgi:ABC-type multidrug transport system ATPase subunit